MTFNKAFSWLISFEGGLVNDPSDPGGLTKYGVSQRSYPDLDIAALTIDDARILYRRDFWDALRCHQMPPAVALVVFDGAVNQGPHAAVLDLQSALGVETDGVIGPVTMAAVGALPPRDVLPRLVARRAMRYAVNPNLTRYGLGWFTRLAAVTVEAATA